MTICKKYYLIGNLLLLICINHKTYTLQKAIINVPVADLIGQPIKTIYPKKQTKDAYDAIAICANQASSAHACPRLHQLLYNDIVDVIKTDNDEAYIRITHAYYINSSSSTPHSQYWMLKQNITFIDELTALTSNHLPFPIDFSDKNNNVPLDTTIVTLTEPHYDSTLRITFSAGTRFTRVPSTTKKNSSTTVNVFAINYKTMKEHQIKIPFHKCIITDQTKSPQEQINDYVNLIKKWAHPKQGFIPYVWGGTSYIDTVQGNFKEVMQKTDNGDYSFYEYDKNIYSPKSGFDCSGMILKAAQICNIPYFCKNTTTIAKCLTPLIPGQQLSPGDLILIQGHVMVVSDIKENKLIESRSYAHNYGKLHEIHINKVFEGIETYDDMVDAYFKKAVIKRKDKQGKIRDTFANFQLLSIASVWSYKN